MTNLSKLIKTIKPDIIHTHSSIDSWLAGIIGNICGVPVVRSRHISIPITSIAPNSWLYSKVPKKVITSGKVISEIVSSVSGVDPKNVKSISAGVDLRKFDFKIENKKQLCNFNILMRTNYHYEYSSLFLFIDLMIENQLIKREIHI